MLLKKGVQPGRGLQVALELEQLHQLVRHQGAIHVPRLSHQDAFDVDPILRAVGECLQHDEILG